MIYEYWGKWSLILGHNANTLSKLAKKTYLCRLFLINLLEEAMWDVWVLNKLPWSALHSVTFRWLKRLSRPWYDLWYHLKSQQNIINGDQVCFSLGFAFEFVLRRNLMVFTPYVFHNIPNDRFIVLMFRSKVVDDQIERMNTASQEAEIQRLSYSSVQSTAVHRFFYNAGRILPNKSELDSNNLMFSSAFPFSFSRRGENASMEISDVLCKLTGKEENIPT